MTPGCGQEDHHEDLDPRHDRQNPEKQARVFTPGPPPIPEPPPSVEYRKIATNAYDNFRMPGRSGPGRCVREERVPGMARFKTCGAVRLQADCESSTSRILRTRESIVTGFWRNETPDAWIPSCNMASPA